MTIYNVFGVDPPPGVYTMYTDGNPGVTMGQDFDTYGNLIPGGNCIGGRVWVPSVEAPHTSTIKIMAWIGGTMADAPLREKEVAVAGPGWVEALWDTPLPIPADGTKVRIGYRFTGTVFGPTRYIHTPGLRASGAAIQKDGLELSAAPSTYLMFDGGAQTPQPSNVGYGIGILYEHNDAPPPVNVPPTVNGGVDRTLFLGQSTTLTAVAGDTDGTISSVAWTQVSGPPVAMGGAGAVRSITPTSTGVHVFSVVATDDDGAVSASDSVTVTVLPAPSSGGAASAELRANRKNTDAFIKADPVVLALTPRTLEKTSGGGKKMVPGTPKGEQMLRLIPQTDVQPSVQTPDGIQLTPTFVLMGRFDADIDRWDTFEMNGHRYQVVSTVRPEHSIENRYETKADVARY